MEAHINNISFDVLCCKMLCLFNDKQLLVCTNKLDFITPNSDDCKKFHYSADEWAKRKL